MRYVSQQITFQEIPDEISLSFLISGCPLRCKGCHSADSWNKAAGQSLTQNKLADFILKYQKVITCVLFLGGEWHSEELIDLLKYCKRQNLKTALYTGLEDVAQNIKAELTFLKTGSWKPELGGLQSAHTNQKLTELATGRIIKFTAQGGQHDEINRTANQ
jgi:anaerobic ribonucleoside-triphosphate reductase activating protein